jgi:plastocyanin
MSRTLRVLALALTVIALAALVGCSSTPAATAPTPAPAPATGGSGSSGGAQAVSIANFAFTPADLSVKVGDTVTWTNNDNVAHTVTFSSFASDQLAPGATYSHKFDTAGSFDYKCSIHPSMLGKITVQ